MVPPADAPAIDQAMRRAGLVWLRPVDQPGPDGTGAARPTAAWVLWRNGAAWLVTGPGEQPAPGVAEAAAVEVTVCSAGTGGRPVTWRASVSRLQPGSPQWREVVPALLARRLNAPDPGRTEERWAARCAVLRLEPTGTPPG